MRILSLSLAVAIAATAMPACAGGPSAAPSPVAAAAPAQATSIKASAALQQRAEDLIKMINGETSPEHIFSPTVLDKVPAARLTAVASAVLKRYGRALAVERIDTLTENKGTVMITFERSQLPIGIGVEAAAPNMITALQF